MPPLHLRIFHIFELFNEVGQRCKYIYIHFPFWSALTSQSKDKNSLHALNERSSKGIRPKEVYSAEATQRNEKVPKTNKNKKEGKRRERMQAEEREKCRGLCVS